MESQPQAKGPLEAFGGLRFRVLALTLAALLAVAVPSAVAFGFLVDATVLKLGTLFAEKQILFDRYRGLESLMREVSLAETVARSPAILDWAEDENDPAKAERGLAELEHYRLSFKDRSYFVVLDSSGNYYFNDKDNTYEKNRRRYTLNRLNPRDAWYYKTAATGTGCHLNVDHDDNLDVTKVWINCLIARGGKTLGIIGTGVDLSQFIREVVDIPQVGVQSMFVDRSGAVQAHRDPKLVDFQSLTKDIKAKSTVFALLDEVRDARALKAMMDEVASGRTLVQSRFMRISGHDALVGVGYLDRLGWFNVTVMDVDRIIERSLFLPIGLLLALILLLAALVCTYVFRRSVLDRLAAMEASVGRLRSGSFGPVAVDPGKDEIGRLSRAFAAMASEIGDNTERLEATVRERTEQLEHLAHHDPLTGLMNRRGFEEAFARERNRLARQNGQAGLILIDLDGFKPVNDAQGHPAGDLVLKEVARRLSAALRNYDLCARWGGDEFIMLVSPADRAGIEAVVAKLLAGIAGAPISLGQAELSMSASIGAVLVGPQDELAAGILRVDTALYAAKAQGKARFVLAADETPHPMQTERVS